MRQGHQNRRGRNRNNGGSRKGQNPVTRSYESNGPDMKIRGTPAHIAEKYIALSRDAQSNGDPVLAENYLQHAEHYNRIILAYRDAQAQHHSADQPPGPNSNGQHRQQNQSSADGDEQPSIDPAEAAQPSMNDHQPQARRQGRGRPNDKRNRPQRSRPPQRSSDQDGNSNRDAEQPDRGEQGTVPEHQQPEFLRRAVRRPRRGSSDNDGDTVPAEDAAQD